MIWAMDLPAMVHASLNERALLTVSSLGKVSPNPGSEMKTHSFCGWLTFIAIALTSSVSLNAAEPSPGSQTGTNAALWAGTPSKRGKWQERMTLGPGDVLNLSLIETPDTARVDVPVGPDGRITFLQARDVMAAGLTIDELRAKMDETLGKFYQNPHVVITPSAFHSKKFVVLGAVANTGAFPLDGPVTVIEAIARAGGLGTGVFEQRTVELADLQRSFLVRNGQRMPVDFERLFQHGDLSQNVPVEPDDFLFFAPASANEVYVLGEVANPGVLAFQPRPTVIKAITARGGFTTRSWKGRVLVLRGSLNHPQTFIINTYDILSAKEPDFALQPRDMVYVGSSPWVKAEDILDTAARAFLTSMFVQWTSLHVGPAITRPLIH
jgi:protein involved in polysaccharide export with SLBB domain